MGIRHATPADAPGISRAHVRSWLAAYRGIVADSFLDALDPVAREPRWREWLAEAPAEGRQVFVAELTGPQPSTIAGFASCGPEREGLVVDGVAYDGEVYALYLAPEYQRQGIGRRLVAVAAGWLVQQGVSRHRHLGAAEERARPCLLRSAGRRALWRKSHHHRPVPTHRRGVLLARRAHTCRIQPLAGHHNH